MKQISNGLNKIKELYHKNNILRHSCEIFITHGIASVVALLNLYLVIKYLGLSQYGIISIAITYSGFFDSLVNFQSYNATIKFGSEAFYSKDYKGLSNYCSLALAQDILTAFISIGLAYLFIDLSASILSWSSFEKKIMALYLPSILLNINSAPKSILRLCNKYTYPGHIETTTNLIKLFLILFLFFFDKLSIKSYLLIELLKNFLLTGALFVLSIIVSLKSIHLFPFTTKLKFDWSFTNYNIFNNLVTTIDMPTGKIVSLIINKYLGFEYVGIYSTFTKIASFTSQVTTPISQAMLPELSRLIALKEVAKAWRIAIKILKYGNLLGLASIILSIITFPIWFHLFLEPNLNNYMFFALYMLYIVFTSSSIGIHNFYFANNYVKYNLIINLFCNTIYLIVLFLTIKQFNLYSVILCMIFQAVLVIYIKCLLVRKKIKLSII